MTRKHHEELQMIPALAGPLVLVGGALLAAGGALVLRIRKGAGR